MKKRTHNLLHDVSYLIPKGSTLTLSDIEVLLSTCRAIKDSETIEVFQM